MTQEAVILGFPYGVRQATVSDIAHLVRLARRQYPEYDLKQAEAWARKILTSECAAIFICRNSVSIVAWQREFWRPDDRIADVLPMFGVAAADDPWAQYRALKAACQWARENGCYAVRFGASIGARTKKRASTDLFAPFAKRLGARVFGVTHILEFR